MKKHYFYVIILVMVLGHYLYGIEIAEIIKVNGNYGIISHGANQGIEEGQIFYVKRETAAGLAEVAQVKVIRTTANRAAVELIPTKKKVSLEKGDKLYADQALIRKQTVGPSPKIEKTATNPPQRPNRPDKAPSQNATETTKRNIEPITEPVHKNADVAPVSRASNFSRKYNLKQPWISFNIGAMFPTGGLGDVYSPSVNFGGSYLVEAAHGFNLGVEISKTILGGGFGNNPVDVASISSSSILEALVVFQKFFGDFFFVEGGGGVYRPKIQTVSIDNVKSSYSASNFGVFGGTGFFVPTSPYAGFSLRGRVHNYFDQTSRQYFGLAGGFRFKIH